MFTHTLRSAARTITRKHTARYTTNNINNINSILEILVKSRNGSGLTIFGVIGTVYFFCGGQDRKLCNLDRKLRSLENDNLLLNRKIDALNKNFGIVVPNSQQQQQNKRPKESIERGGDEADDAATGTTLPHSFEASKINGTVNYPCLLNWKNQLWNDGRSFPFKDLNTLDLGPTSAPVRFW